MLQLVNINKYNSKQPLLIVLFKENLQQSISGISIKLSEEEINYITKNADIEVDMFRLPRIDTDIFIHLIKISKNNNLQDTGLYTEGAVFYKAIIKYKFNEIVFTGFNNDLQTISYTEGFLLASYSFNKYKTGNLEKQVKKIYFLKNRIKATDIQRLKCIVESVFWARDAINEPGSVLTSEELSKRIVLLGKTAGFDVEVYHKTKIKALKMGGLLSINRGSKNPPTFSILEYKPENAINEKPLILVGKGIVFDTGGLSLKPTPNSMDYMKSDMSGAAVVIATIYAITKLKLPIHIIGLIPSTDNRPGEDAILPGDIVTMYDKTTVEVLNTDAEGRMILADALAFSKQYQPDLVIDIATLTGAASVAVGKYAMVGFFKCDINTHNQLIQAGFDVEEKIVEFPLWDEYAELLKSDIADLKNIGGREAGAITAAKFLEKFTDYPWIHLDIAGLSFAHTDYKYYPKGGTAIGIRLLLNFIIKKYLS